MKIPFDPYRDFTPVTLAGTMPNVIVTHPSVPAKTVKELIALVKANPGKYNYAHPSTGTTPHLAGELFKLTFGLDLLTVPFNGAGPAVQSLVGGDTPIGFLALLPVASNIKSGNLRCLVVLAKQRSETKDIKQRPVFGAVLPVRRPSEPAARLPAIAARIRRQHPSGGPDGALERPHLGAQLLQFPSTSWSRKERAGRRLPPSPGPKPQPESGVGGDGAQAVTGEDLPPASSFRVDLNQIRWCRCRRRVGGERRRFAYQRLRRYNP